MSNMDEKDELKLFFQIILKGLQYISHNIIQSGKESRDFLVKKLGNKDGEGSSIGSQHGERKSPGGFIFSNTGLHNQPDEFKGEMKS